MSHTSEPAAKRARSDVDLAKDASAIKAQSREGYFGDPNATCESNATGEPRIVLATNYGVDGAGNPSASRDETNSLQGLAGRYKDKVVIITGAARGIGEGCARVFHAAGSHVVLCDRNEAGSVALARELAATGLHEPFCVKADVSVVAELKNVVDRTMEKFGRLDCLINNAGWHPPPKTIDEFSVDDMQDVMQLNFISLFALCKFAIPHIRKVQGNIINISSLVGAFGQKHATTYAATKGATTAFSKALAIDEAKYNVRVNTVSPGNIWTPLWKAGADAEADPAAARAAGERVQVMGRMGTILETGRLCLCIAADLTFTTGVDHILSGGAEIGYGLK